LSAFCTVSSKQPSAPGPAISTAAAIMALWPSCSGLKLPGRYTRLLPAPQRGASTNTWPPLNSTQRTRPASSSCSGSGAGTNLLLTSSCTSSCSMLLAWLLLSSCRLAAAAAVSAASDSGPAGALARARMTGRGGSDCGSKSHARAKTCRKNENQLAVDTHTQLWQGVCGSLCNPQQPPYTACWSLCTTHFLQAHQHTTCGVSILIWRLPKHVCHVVQQRAQITRHLHF
jgi:hypothetical protein